MYEYVQEIPQSKTAENSMVPRGKATSRDTGKTNKAKQPALSTPSTAFQKIVSLTLFVLQSSVKLPLCDEQT